MASSSRRWVEKKKNEKTFLFGKKEMKKLLLVCFFPSAQRRDSHLGASHLAVHLSHGAGSLVRGGESDERGATAVVL